MKVLLGAGQVAEFFVWRGGNPPAGDRWRVERVFQLSVLAAGLPPRLEAGGSLRRRVAEELGSNHAGGGSGKGGA